ncbi:MAG TPA: basic secretory protein-like protein [Verrucomicrobiae bacterium]|jgi:hypothetical protein|nr:basic secretory protein-like protein [Verrucomicrobiae bacterium]
MKTVLLLAFGLMAAALAGCFNQRAATSGATPSTIRSIRKVRFEGTAEMPELAAQARSLGDELYPKVVRLLGDDTQARARQIDIVFKRNLTGQFKGALKRSARNMPKFGTFTLPGAAQGTTIYLDVEELKKDPSDLERLLLHEMAHTAQGYRWYRFWRAPYYWREGVADYVAYQLTRTNIAGAGGTSCARCSALWPHYTSGYACAAAFLIFVEGAYDPKIVPKLQRALWSGSYDDALFQAATGKALEELWAEFLRTSAVTSIAAKMNMVYEALGYKGGNPPADVEARFSVYLERQPNGAEISRLLGLSSLSGKPIPDIQTRIALYLYFSEQGDSGGSAAAYLYRLGERGELPGFNKGDHAALIEPLTLADIDAATATDALNRNVRGEKQGDGSIYHYRVTRDRTEAPWHLVKAWRTSAEGQMVEEYTLP